MKPNSAQALTAAFAGASSGRERQSLGVQTALVGLRAYKVLISPLFVGSCRFVPSCSDYAADAIRAHGVFRGGLLAARRLARCQPFCAGGHDPVPPRP